MEDIDGIKKIEMLDIKILLKQSKTKMKLSSAYFQKIGDM